MTLATIIGLAACICTTTAFLPQVIRAWSTRSTRDISVGMFTLYSVGLLLWLIYGLMRRDLPLIASNSVTLVLALTILGLKLRHG